MPPAEYQDRFVSALEGYFLACPGMLLLPCCSAFLKDAQ